MFVIQIYNKNTYIKGQNTHRHQITILLTSIFMTEDISSNIMYQLIDMANDILHCIICSQDHAQLSRKCSLLSAEF